MNKFLIMNYLKFSILLDVFYNDQSNNERAIIKKKKEQHFSEPNRNVYYVFDI